LQFFLENLYEGLQFLLEKLYVK